MCIYYIGGSYNMQCCETLCVYYISLYSFFVFHMRLMSMYDNLYVACHRRHPILERESGTVSHVYSSRANDRNNRRHDNEDEVRWVRCAVVDGKRQYAARCLVWGLVVERDRDRAAIPRAPTNLSVIEGVSVEMKYVCVTKYWLLKKGRVVSYVSYT